MNLDQHLLGPMDNFIYIISDPETKEAAIVDPGWEVPFLIRQLEESALDLKFVLLTHGHYDHVQALPEVLDYKDVPVYLSDKEHPLITPTAPQMIRFDGTLDINLGKINIQTIETPGHSPGSACFKLTHPDTPEMHLITGDTIFVRGCGRTDLPGGDTQTLISSIQKLKSLPDDTIIYPGHSYGGHTDTIGNQKVGNPVF